jgi:drug/metabolite transporter (DMT)-like permease
VLGLGIVLYHGSFEKVMIHGFLLVQVSNISFALGQVVYKRVMRKYSFMEDYRIFGLLYLGGALITGIASGMTASWSGIHLNLTQVFTLLYLGVLASGLCFFLWNYGARRTNVGALAVSNNLKIPLAVTCSMVCFGESGNIPKLLVGGGIILIALFINEFMVKKFKKGD